MNASMKKKMRSNNDQNLEIENVLQLPEPKTRSKSIRASIKEDLSMSDDNNELSNKESI